MPSGLLFPNEERIVRHRIEIRGTLLRSVALDGGYTFKIGENPILVQVQDLGGQVYDNLAWFGDIRPFTIEKGEIKIDDGWSSRLPRHGLRQRHYNFLGVHDLAADENSGLSASPAP